MDDLLLAAIAFALSQVALSVLLLCSHNRWAIQERLFGILLVAISGFLLAPVCRQTPLSVFLQPLLTAVPGVFWLFSASLFDDHFRLKLWQIMLVGITVVVPTVGETFRDFFGGEYEFLLFDIPQMLEFMLLGLALLVVARNWQADLIESRRRLRLWLVGLNGCYIVTMIFLRQVVFPEAEWMETLEYVPVGGMLLVTNFIFLQYKSDIWPGYSAAPAHPCKSAPENAGEVMASEPIDLELISCLQRLMDEQAVYREMGLTIGQLARQLELPEYRLRHLINSALGYRNFNDFLNSYRIREASQRFSDAGQGDISILAIALDVGFRSLSSFNKAFKQTFGVTPTVYRRDQVQKRN